MLHRPVKGKKKTGASADISERRSLQTKAVENGFVRRQVTSVVLTAGCCFFLRRYLLKSRESRVCFFANGHGLKFPEHGELLRYYFEDLTQTVSVIHPHCVPQDDASPAALTDLCLTYVSQNLECFCVKRPDGSLCFREAVHFPQELADQLLAKMATEGKLMDVKSTLGVCL